MKRLLINLTDEQHEYIRNQAYDNMISMSEFVKKSIGKANDKKDTSTLLKPDKSGK